MFGEDFHVKNPIKTITEIIINGNKSINFDTDGVETSIYNDNNHSVIIIIYNNANTTTLVYKNDIAVFFP